MDKYLIAGTGSRSFAKLPGKTQVKMIKAMSDKLTEGLTVHTSGIIVLSGMAEGWDEMIAQAAIDAGVPFAAIVPNPSYGEYYWGKKSQTGHNRLDAYNSLLSQAFKTITVSDNIMGDERYPFPGGANFLRNEVMINGVDKVWTCFNPETGPTSGTKHAVEYSKRNGIGVFNWYGRF